MSVLPLKFYFFVLTLLGVEKARVPMRESYLSYMAPVRAGIQQCEGLKYYICGVRTCTYVHLPELMSILPN
jgi:hypothetical protein